MENCETVGGCDMRVPSNADAFEVLCLQAADEGRGAVLFGECLARAREVVRPFIPEGDFPSTYLEFPLVGDPFLDVTVLYSSVEPGMRIDSDAANGTEEVLDWVAQAISSDDNVGFGFEIDVKDPQTSAAAIHFQPRNHTDLVKPFCEAAGVPEKGDLYLSCANRMPKGWPLSFFGMFRGRSDSPLRICGYIGSTESEKCAGDAGHIREVFETVGFTAFDEAMLEQAREVFEIAPSTVDFQFDVYPDGTLGDTFAIDVQFDFKQPDAVRADFETGDGWRFMSWLQEHGIADERWKLAANAAFARKIPVQLEDGTPKHFSFVIMPQWVKVRWRNGQLQPAKIYYSAKCDLF